MERNGNPQLFSEEPRPCAQAAILSAAGFDEAAAELLRAETRTSDSGDPAAWRMLLEICHLRDRHDEFDRVAAAYVDAFGSEAPLAWGYATPIGVADVLQFQGILASTRDIAPLGERAPTRRTIALDFSRVRRIAFAFAPELCSLFRAYGMQGKRILVANVMELHAQLLETVGKASELVLMRRPATKAGVSAPGARASPARLASDFAVAA